MDLSFDEIMRIYRLEKNSPKHVAVDESFFEDMRKFFAKERAAYLHSLKDIGSSKAAAFSNLKKIAEELFSLREKKLLNKALIASRTGEMQNGQLAAQERETLKQLLTVLEKHQRFLLEIIGGEAKKLAAEEKKAVEIKLLQDIPAFVGTDMKEYGPFQKEKTASVPPKIASLLIARKLAEKAKGE